MEENVLSALSDAMVRSAAAGGAITLQVDARRRGAASGTAYQPDMVLTANHAVEREADIHIGMPDGRILPARIAGRDPGMDLCLLHLEQASLFTAQTAPGEAQLGQIVLALGRPDSEGLQASLGVVGAVGGPLHTSHGGMIERFIRTDAIPYPGFSGGPLVDGNGQVLGINTSGFAPGASLAIPAGTAWRVASSLARFGRVRRGYLGIRSQVVEIPASSAQILNRAQSTGLLLVGVERGQPAERAGLMVGDILTGLNGTPIADQDALLDRLNEDVTGKVLPLEIIRGGKLTRIDIQVGERS